METKQLNEDLLRALEELRRTTGVDEWDESDWRCLAYCDAWEALGEDRAYEVIGEVHAERYLHADDVLFTIKHGAGHIRTTSKEQACADMAEYVAKSFDVVHNETTPASGNAR